MRTPHLLRIVDARSAAPHRMALAAGHSTDSATATERGTPPALPTVYDEWAVM